MSGERLPILYRDDHLVVVHKPSGLLVHRSQLDRHATRFAVQIVRDQVGRHVHPLHRLDKGTSGILIFAFDKAVGSVLAGQFAGGQVGKRYLAVVRGIPTDTGEIDHPLARLQDDAEGCDADACPPAQAALTRFRRLASIELPVRVDRYPSSRYALLEVEPLTGRRHQIRRHLKHIAHPVIGDSTYGKGRHNRLFQTLLDCRRLLLACVGMRLRHPVSGAVLDITAAPADDFAEPLRRAGFPVQFLR